MKKITVENLTKVAREIKKVETEIKKGTNPYTEVNLAINLNTNLLEITHIAYTGYNGDYNYTHIDTLCLYKKDYGDGKQVRTIPQIVNSLKKIIEEKL